MNKGVICIFKGHVTIVEYLELYSLWKFRVKHLLKKEGLWLLVSNDGNNTQANSGATSSSGSLVGGGVTNTVAIVSGVALFFGSLA